MSAAVVDVYQTPNKKTKSGEPRRWRWHAADPVGGHPGRSLHSFRTEDKCRADIAQHPELADRRIVTRAWPWHPPREHTLLRPLRKRRTHGTQRMPQTH